MQGSRGGDARDRRGFGCGVKAGFIRGAEAQVLLSSQLVLRRRGVPVVAALEWHRSRLTAGLWAPLALHAPQVLELSRGDALRCSVHGRSARPASNWSRTRGAALERRDAERHDAGT